MASETDVILRTALHHTLKGKTKAQIERSMKAMCPADMIAAVEKQVKEDLLAEEKERAENS
ncbi:MAG: hypothetical protein FWD96_01845 [Defluviitaleaceae bacterium]|nr:hypothetical protein [Defluviitaleaceae bacterium]